MSRPALLLALAVVLLAPLPGAAQEAERSATPVLVLDAPDRGELRQADERRVASGRMAHVAVRRALGVDPWTAGAWSVEDDRLARWTLDVASRGARSLSFLLDRARLPAGAELSIVGVAGGRHELGGAEGVDLRRSFTPPVGGGTARFVLEVPVERMDAVELEIGALFHGYAGIGPWGATSGRCQVDVACAEGRDWRTSAPSVVSLLVDGVRTCTGVLLANTSGDRRPLVATAAHCGLGRRSAGSVVAWWGHRAESCGADAAASDRRSPPSTTGARLLARIPRLDVALLELDADPPPEARFAGWDRTAAALAGPVATLHHPGSDRLRLAISEDAPEPSDWLSEPARAGASGDYLRVARWSTGSTEGGSSGAPLFDVDGRVIGLLRGGWAACGNGRADWFSRLGAGWDGPDPSTRLRDWLDPAGTDVRAIDGDVVAAED